MPLYERLHSYFLLDFFLSSFIRISIKIPSPGHFHPMIYNKFHSFLFSKRSDNKTLIIALERSILLHGNEHVIHPMHHIQDTIIKCLKTEHNIVKRI